MLSLPLLGACHAIAPQSAHRDPPCLASLPPATRQAVIVSASPGEPGHKVRVLTMEKTENGWETAGDPFDGVAGRNGLAPLGEKREGDGRTPSGTFALKRAFGYFPFDAGIEYIIMSTLAIWIDDPISPQYNMLASRPPAARSFEVMRRGDDLYKYGIVIEYNTESVVPGAGSAIFFHLWNGPNSSTSGCVAVSEPNMLRLLHWLDRSKHPVAVIGPPAVFR